MDFKGQENRALFIALFRWMDLRQVRNFCISCFQIFACYQTALEFSQVLLTLDMDPLAIVLLVNFYALLLLVAASNHDPQLRGG